MASADHVCFRGEVEKALREAADRLAALSFEDEANWRRIITLESKGCPRLFGSRL